jgi:PTH2 family peptidyl-tRNA hydrolase
MSTLKQSDASSSVIKMVDTSIKMYLVVNTEVRDEEGRVRKMGAGKIAAQCGHAVEALTERLIAAPTAAYRDWRRTGRAKIALRATVLEIERLIELYQGMVETVYDAGKTQIAAGSLTVVGFPPLVPEDVPAELRALRLL